MKFITLAELEDIELREDVKEVEFNGISGQDESSDWYTVYYTDGTTSNTDANYVFSTIGSNKSLSSGTFATKYPLFSNNLITSLMLFSIYSPPMKERFRYFTYFF